MADKTKIDWCGKEEKWQPLTGCRRGWLRVLPREAEGEEEKPTSLNTDIYVRDRAYNTIHRVGDDRHDSLWVDESGTVHYCNLQNGDGCGAYSIKDKNEIRCRVCGRQTAKHVRMEDAERDWQYMNEKAAREAEIGGPEDGQADGGN